MHPAKLLAITAPQRLDRDLHSLEGILQGITIDQRHAAVARCARRRQRGQRRHGPGSLGVAGLAGSVSARRDYLVVCDGGNRTWAFSCDGRKVEQAMQLRKDGCRITLVGESDLWDEFEERGWSRHG